MLKFPLGPQKCPFCQSWIKFHYKSKRQCRKLEEFLSPKCAIGIPRKVLSDSKLFQLTDSFFFSFSWGLFFFNFKILFYLFFYTAGSYQLSILYILVYICQSQSPNSSYHHPYPATFPPWCPYVCSLNLCLCFCPANRFICTIFLGSTYVH